MRDVVQVGGLRSSRYHHVAEQIGAGDGVDKNYRSHDKDKVEQVRQNQVDRVHYGFEVLRVLGQFNHS